MAAPPLNIFIFILNKYFYWDILNKKIIIKFVLNIKKKYINVYMNRSWSVRSGNKNSKINYNIININDSVKEKTCIQADKDNEKKYRQFVEKAQRTSEKWQNTGAKMNLEVPKP